MWKTYPRLDLTDFDIKDCFAVRSLYSCLYACFVNRQCLSTVYVHSGKCCLKYVTSKDHELTDMTVVDYYELNDVTKGTASLIYK